jgi:hypothetical protein
MPYFVAVSYQLRARRISRKVAKSQRKTLVIYLNYLKDFLRLGALASLREIDLSLLLKADR